jgi:hypothetical protein
MPSSVSSFNVGASGLPLLVTKIGLIAASPLERLLHRGDKFVVCDEAGDAE